MSKDDQLSEGCLRCRDYEQVKSELENLKEKTETQSEENPWSVQPYRMFDMSNDSTVFRTKKQLEAAGWSLQGNIFFRNKDQYLPLIEAKLIHLYNHRFSTFYSGMESRSSTSAELQDSTYVGLPRYWVPKPEVQKRLKDRWYKEWLLGYRWITRSTDERTLIFGIFPKLGTGSSLPVVCAKQDIRFLGSILQSFVLDYVARQFVGGANCTFGILKQLPVLRPQQIEDFPFQHHVLEMTYTSWELQPFAQDCGYYGAPFKWNEERRFLMRCEMDAYFFHKYLGSAQEWTDNASEELKQHFATPRDAVAYIMDTFVIVRRRDISAFGNYKSKSMILNIFDKLQKAMDLGESYQSMLHPPAADPRLAQRERS